MSWASRAIEDVWAERLRQMEVKGFTHEIDDSHAPGELAQVAALYAIASTIREWTFQGAWSSLWPESWSRRWWKPKGMRRNLVKAAALLVAEIERLDRAAERG